MGTGQRSIAWLLITTGTLALMYYFFRAVTGTPDFTRLVPSAFIAFASILIGVQQFIRQTHERQANILLGTGLLVMVSSVIAQITSEIVNR